MGKTDRVMQKVTVDEKLAFFREYWRPLIVGKSTHG